MSNTMVCPKCGSTKIGENIVDWGDDDEEFYCAKCHHVGSRETFTPKVEPEVAEPPEDVPKPP